MRLYMYNLRPLIYDIMITFITFFVNDSLKRHLVLIKALKWLCYNKVIYYFNIDILYILNITLISHIFTQDIF